MSFECYGVLFPISRGYLPVKGRLHTRYAPVRHSCVSEETLPFDLHVLSLPLAFILSQDQTLHCKNCLIFIFQGILFLSQKEIGNPLLGSSSILSKNIFFLFFSLFSRSLEKGLQRYNPFLNLQNIFEKILEKISKITGGKGWQR